MVFVDLKSKLNNIFIGFPTGKTNPKNTDFFFPHQNRYTVIPAGRKIKLIFNYLNYKG